MKKSNIYLITSVVFFLASLLVYNFGLKARYNNGDFKNPDYEFKTLNFEGFDTILVNASTVTNVKFVQGDFKVRVFEDRADIVKVTQRGKSLIIDADIKSNNYEESPFTLIISCPKINLLVSDERYLSNGKLTVDTNARLDVVIDNRIIQPAKKIVIDGFVQDSMAIIQNNGSHVRLVNNKLKTILATIGQAPGSGSFLTVDSSNVFNFAHFDMRNKSQLFISKATIHNLDYKLAPDAKVTFSGTSAAHFK
ncbi:MAG: hypothetical protein V4721_02395 [Bacteroidota bacterium]